MNSLFIRLQRVASMPGSQVPDAVVKYFQHDLQAGLKGSHSFVAPDPLDAVQIR